MPQEPNKALRIFVPLVVAGVAIAIALTMFPKGKPNPAPTPAPTSTGSADASKAADRAQAPAATAPLGSGPAASTPASPAASSAPPPQATQPAPPQTPATTGGTLRARVFAGEDLATNYDGLGALDEAKTSAERAGKPRARVEFSSTGSGVRSFVLADYYETIKKERKVELQGQHVLEAKDAAGNVVSRAVLAPFAALAITVNGQTIALDGRPDAPIWRQVARDKPGAFEAFIQDESGRDVLRISREYVKPAGGYTIELRQRVENQSGTPMAVRWFQLGPVDPPKDQLAYIGDRRTFRFGYLWSPEKDPTRGVVNSGSYAIPHQEVVARPRETDAVPAEKALWPNRKSEDEKYTLVWTGVTNRYFGVAAYPMTELNPPAGQVVNKAFGWVAGVDRVVLDAGAKHEIVGVRLNSAELRLAPGGQPGASADLSMGVFAGPLDADVIDQDPIAKALAVKGLIYHNMGGMCAFCTFEWLTNLLLWLLQNLHNYVVFDWALAIMCLVLIVRTCLHPVTKWSQIRMTRFGKKMGGMAPKMKALQEKYGDDKVKLQQETAKLWREEGVSPAGFLGCLPMFLQTPVWIALYATLFFAVELRHQPAFFGVMQRIIPSGTIFSDFLADLAEPDRFLHFSGAGVHVPLLSSLIGPVSGLNILPLILGVVFFIQQKYLTPPTTTPLTPEQEMQQKMIKWMTVIMFPLFMYNAPSGLTIYFTTNSVLSILENRYIRRHIDELDKKAPPPEKGKAGKPGKPGTPGKKSFMERVMEAAEERRKQMEQQKARGKR